MLEGMKLSKIQVQKEIKFIDPTGKGTRLGLIVVRLLDSYQRGEKKNRREERRQEQCVRETNWKTQSNFDAIAKKKRGA